MPNTNVTRIGMNQHQNDLEDLIVSICDNQRDGGFILASTFVLGTELVMIFSKPPE